MLDADLLISAVTELTGLVLHSITDQNTLLTELKERDSLGTAGSGGTLQHGCRLRAKHKERLKL